MSTNSFEVDSVLQRLAGRQSGVFSVGQALHAGISRSAIDRRRRAGL